MKPPGRLDKTYRIMWCDDSGASAGHHHPPVSPQKLLQISFGDLAGTPVDAFVATVGPAAGYTLSYPTQVPGMEFIVDRLAKGATIGEGAQWRVAENLRHLWAQGCDPIALQLDRAHQLGIDYWLQLRLNDWHHVDAQGQVYRLIGSQFYEENPQYLLGRQGVQGWPPRLRESMAWFQDFAHQPVRDMRLAVAVEACQRYDVDGFEYDFMRCPGYFKFGQERANAPLMSQLLRDTRAALDRIGAQKGKAIGLSVRVPNTVDGALRLGLDVPAWIDEKLVDIVVPSTFFAADTQEDMSEWAALTGPTPVRLHPALEEAYSAGYTDDRPGVPYYQLPDSVMRPLTRPMIHAIAARHWNQGADGLYLFNWANTPTSYHCDHRPTLDDIGDPQRLACKDKRYVLMRANGSFPNCLPTDRPLPARLGPDPLRLDIAVEDDLHQYGARLESISLRLLFGELTVADQVEVHLNDRLLNCANPLEPEAAAAAVPTAWQVYDLRQAKPRRGPNQLSLRLVQGPAAFRRQVPLEITDVELDIVYGHP